MAVEIGVKGEVVTAYLSGEIDHHSAAGMREKIDNAVDSNMPSALVLDFGNVSFMDSSGIGLVMGRYKNLQKTGAKLHIIGASEQISKIMKLAGMNRLASIN
ncbi:MAG: STAS domain-containing protein [Clostridia bacterium]|nr:STAS domain-containing protein [Clostridia bacterium]